MLIKMKLFHLKNILRVTVLIGFVMLLHNLKILNFRYHNLSTNAETNSTLRALVNSSTWESIVSIQNVSVQSTTQSFEKFSTTKADRITDNSIAIQDKTKSSDLTWITNVSFITISYH